MPRHPSCLFVFSSRVKKEKKKKKKIKTLNRRWNIKKGQEEQETGTWIVWGGSAFWASFYFLHFWCRFFLKISFVCCFRQRLDCQWLVHVCVYIPYPCTYTKPHRDRGIKQSKEAAGKSERNKKQPEWVWPAKRPDQQTQAIRQLNQRSNFLPRLHKRNMTACVRSRWWPHLLLSVSLSNRLIFYRLPHLLIACNYC